MKTGYRLMGLLFFLGSTVTGLCAPSVENSRIKEPLCEAWAFHLGDVEGAEKADFDDSSWRTLDVPHDWSIELPFDANMPGGSGVGYLPGGLGWYRKTFAVPVQSKGKQVFVDFDGVYMDSQVWINGHLLGRRPNGYVSFRYDLTPYLNYGDEKNVIAVRVNVEPSGSRWYPGAGIYRRVWLTTVNPVHISLWGTYVTTPEVSKEVARVNLSTDVENQSGNAADITLHSVIMDAEGRTVANADTTQRVGAGAMQKIEQTFSVTQPQLWSPDTPDMYQIVSTVTAGGKTVDEYTTPLGIRRVEFTNDQGFFLNGEHVDIKGVCLHHDFGPIGTAFYPRALERQLEILREMGCNAIRTSHNPRDPEFYNICDRMGFMVMDEAFDVWEQKKLGNDFHKFFKEWHERDLTAMVLRDRNHPCVIIWSIGNEMNEQHREDFPGQGGVIATRLVEIVKQHDPSRAITSACNSYKASVEKGMVEPLDVYGQNYGMTQFPEIRKGGKPVIGSENATSFITRGSYAYEIVQDRGMKLAIQNFKNNSECTGYGKFWGDDRTEGTLIEMRKNPWVAGQFAWTGFDYLGECFPFSWPARNGLFGIIDMVGFPKDSYYVYQADWTDEPTVHIIPQNWNWPQYNGKPIPVWVYSNAEEVELFLNNKSLGIKPIKRNESLHVEWPVNYSAGELKAVGRTDGRAVCTNIVRTAGEPTRLELSADRVEIAADGSDLSFIEVRLVDEKGVVCPDSDRMIRVQIEGAGTLVGIGNGNAFNHEPFKGNQVRTFYGLCRVIVKSTKQAGAIQLKISADEVDGGVISIATLPAGNPRLAAVAAEREAGVRAQNKQFSRHRLAVIRQVGNLVAGGVVSASSTQENHPPSHAIDGDLETRWCPNDGSVGHFWQIDLGGSRDLRGAKIIWQRANKYQYTVEGSVDGSNWVMLSDQSNRQDMAQEHNLSFDRAGVRHVRITATGLPKSLWGTFYEVEIYGIMADEIQQPSMEESVMAKGDLTVAPVFKHGSGQHIDSIIASRNKKPPTWSEADARKIVVDEAKRQGLEFTVEGKLPMGFDGVSKTGNIVFEVLTSEDVPDRTDNTDHITDFLGAAKKLVEELKTKPGDYVVGVFYDPLVGKGEVPDEEPLRQQVRDFVTWLKKEHHLD